MTPPPDHELRSALADPATRGDAVRRLVQAYGHQLHARIVSLAGPLFADDLFQNTLVKIIAGAPTFEGRSTVYSWAYRVATNEALDFLRSERRRGRGRHTSTDVLFDLGADGDLPPPEQIERRLAVAIERLPPKQRTVFEERYYHETTYADLSERSGTSVGALKASYHLAVQKVTAHLRLHALAVDV